MNIKAVLWKHDMRKDGTCAIKIYVNAAGKVRYYPTGLHVLEAEWDKGRREVKRNHPYARAYNQEIQKKRLQLEHHFVHGGDHDFGKKKDSKSLMDFLEGVIQEAKDGKLDLTKGTIKNYGSLLSRLKKYLLHHRLDDLSFDDVNLEFYKSFVDFLVEHCACALAGAGKHIKNLKAIMNRALDRELHDNTAHQKKEFKVFRIEPHKIFLNQNDIQALVNLDLSDSPFLERERDRFLISYYFILRFSDVNRLSRDMVFESEGQKYLRIRHQKTETEAIIPAKQHALDLLERHDFQMNFTANQIANRHLKTIAGMAGINELTVESSRTLPKSHFVTTHTARRSAATNLYLQGVSLKTIADLGGWKSVKTLMIYLKSSGMDSARMAAGFEFFR
jgi:site-specific recombinase XerD